jgi:hypothetical protein
VLAGSAALRRSPQLQRSSSLAALRSPAVLAGSAALRRSPQLQRSSRLAALRSPAVLAGSAALRSRAVLGSLRSRSPNLEPGDADRP